MLELLASSSEAVKEFLGFEVSKEEGGPCEVMGKAVGRGQPGWQACAASGWVTLDEAFQALGIRFVARSAGPVIAGLFRYDEFQKGLHCALDSTVGYHNSIGPQRRVLCPLLLDFRPSWKTGERDVLCGSGSWLGDGIWKHEHTGQLLEWPLAEVRVSMK